MGGFAGCLPFLRRITQAETPRFIRAIVANSRPQTLTNSKKQKGPVDHAPGMLVYSIGSWALDALAQTTFFAFDQVDDIAAVPDKNHPGRQQIDHVHRLQKTDQHQDQKGDARRCH